MIKAEVGYKNCKQGVELIITGTKEALFNEFRAIFIKVADDVLNIIVNDALASLEREEIIKNFKENK